MAPLKHFLTITLCCLATAPAGAAPLTQYGRASHYCDRKTANGEKMDCHQAMTCAHRTLAFGTRVRVTAIKTGRQVVCRVNDRGPFIAGRIVDLSYGAFEALAPLSVGVLEVELTPLTPVL